MIYKMLLVPAQIWTLRSVLAVILIIPCLEQLHRKIDLHNAYESFYTIFVTSFFVRACKWQ